MLTFVIPTRKRHRELSACLRSIADQVEETKSDVRVHIIHNEGEEETQRVVDRSKSRWSFVTSESCEGEPDYTDKFRMMFRASKGSEWVWTFGDDDVLTPGALKYMLWRLKKETSSFLHVSEKKRSQSSGHAMTGRLIDLCNTIGWIEATGYIPCNIGRGDMFAECAETRNWDLYAKSSFVQSPAILEVFRKEQATFIDQPLVDMPEPTDERKKIMAEDWKKANSGARYLYLAEALEALFAQGFIKGKLPAKFFRYHHYHLWDRHISNSIAMYVGEGEMWFDDWAIHAKKLTEFLADEEMAKAIVANIDAARRWVLLFAAVKEQGKALEDGLHKIYQQHNVLTYPFQYIDGVPDLERKVA